MNWDQTTNQYGQPFKNPESTEYWEPKTLNENEKKSSLPWFLFFATIITTIIAGTLQQGLNPLSKWNNFVYGIPFSFTLMLILGIHELGHYTLCKIHRVPATVPYFIPLPIPSILGTLGAFIKIKGRIPHRRALLDIGMAGPISGFFIALPATILGYLLSQPVPQFYNEGIKLGYSILTWSLEKLIFPSLPEGFETIVLHPIGFAGYIGLFVTTMNLLPIGQLDGGHILSALFNEKQWRISRYFLVILAILGFAWQGWWFWAFLSILMGYRHPVIQRDARPLGKLRQRMALLTFIIFIICFSPVPFSID